MKGFMAIVVVFMFGAASFVFAQTSDVKLPRAAEVKEQLKQDVREMKRDVIKMKDAVQQGLKEDINGTKESVKDVKKAVDKEVKQLKQ